MSGGRNFDARFQSRQTLALSDGSRDQIHHGCPLLLNIRRLIILRHAGIVGEVAGVRELFNCLVERRTAEIGLF